MKVELIKERPVQGKSLDVKRLMNWIVYGDKKHFYDKNV